MIYCIRPLQAADLAAVEALEHETLSPWHFDNGWGSTRDVGLVMQTPAGELAGWCYCRLVVPEAELLKISVGRLYRRKGLGYVLLQALVDCLRQRECGELYLEVRAANLAALRLYGRSKFIQVGLRRRYYSDPVDDAVVMKLTLGTHGARLG